MNTRHPLVIPTLPMKDMDGAMLTIALHDETDHLSEADGKMLKNAVCLAAYLHRTDTRKSPTQSTSGKRHQPSSPYIEHPLRNTLRLARWGVKDVATLAASMLHDVVEDHAKDIVAEFTYSPAEVLASEAATRKVALAYLASVFSQEIADIVEGVSNPIIDVHAVPREQRNVMYVEHVAQEIAANPKVFLVKTADLADNALSLHHSFDVLNKGAILRAAKYLPLMPIVLEVMDNNAEAIRALMSDAGMKDLHKRFSNAEQYLKQFTDAA